LDLVVTLGAVPYTLKKSPYIQANATGPDTIVSINAYIRNSSNALIAGPIPLSNNVNTQFSSGFTLVKNTDYTFIVEATDSTGAVVSKSGLFRSANCAEVDPNDITADVGICDGVGLPTTLGWKMQGGLVLSYNATTVLVVASTLQSLSESWGSTTTGSYVLETNLATKDSVDPFDKLNLGTGILQSCSLSTKASFTSWFLPRINEMGTLICRSNFNGQTTGNPYPQTDPYCAATARSSVYSLNNSLTYWTSTEKDASNAYVFDNHANFAPQHKSNSAATLCMRSFTRMKLN
jgi:hypothetical protein